jgi:hypothetical protein
LLTTRPPTVASALFGADFMTVCRIGIPELARDGELNFAAGKVIVSIKSRVEEEGKCIGNLSLPYCPLWLVQF